MKKLATITLLFLLYSPIHAQTYRLKEEDRFKLKPYIPSIESVELQSYPLKPQLENLYQQAFGGDKQTLESVCEFLGPIGVVVNTATEYKAEEKKRLNALQKVVQYITGLKVKTDKLKKYFKWEF